MEYFGNEVDGKDLGIIISTLDGCLPCMALLGCDCQKSAAQMLNEQLAGIGADEGDPTAKAIANTVASAGTAAFAAWQASQAAPKVAAASSGAISTIATVGTIGLVAVAAIWGATKIWGKR